MPRAQDDKSSTEMEDERPQQALDGEDDDGTEKLLNLLGEFGHTTASKTAAVLELLRTRQDVELNIEPYAPVVNPLYALCQFAVSREGDGDGLEGNLIKVLVEHGARAVTPIDAHDTPLIVSVRGRHNGLVLALLECGADANGNDGYSPVLHLAVSQGCSMMVDWLLQYGADRNGRDRGGNTAYDIAQQAVMEFETRQQIIRLLQSPGAGAAPPPLASSAATVPAAVIPPRAQSSVTAFTHADGVPMTPREAAMQAHIDELRDKVEALKTANKALRSELRDVKGDRDLLNVAVGRLEGIVKHVDGTYDTNFFASYTTDLDALQWVAGSVEEDSNSDEVPAELIATTAATTAAAAVTTTTVVSQPSPASGPLPAATPLPFFAPAAPVGFNATDKEADSAFLPHTLTTGEVITVDMVRLVIEQIGASMDNPSDRVRVIRALIKHRGDVVETIMELCI